MLQTFENIRLSGAQRHHVKVANVPEMGQTMFHKRHSYIHFVHFEQVEFEPKTPCHLYIEITKYEESMICLTVSL